MKDYSKTERKQLRELLEKAYVIEMDSYLLQLSQQFDSWKTKKINCWDLSDRIHKFHDDTSRKLFNFYNANGIDKAYLVATLIDRNVLTPDDVPEEILPYVERCLAIIESFRNDEDSE